MTRALIMMFAVSLAACCQTPVISSFVNSASYQQTVGAEGSIATIFGTNLANTTATAQVLPLPLQLGGTSVTVGGVAAPLLYVSPTQINLQVPSFGNIVVSTAAGSASYDPTVATPDAWHAGAIFSMDASGCGRGAVLNVAADGSLSINSPGNSASPGDWISIYGTGFFEVFQSVMDRWINVPAPSNPPVPSSEPGSGGAEFDLSLAGGLGWEGLAPGYVGLYQLNTQIPAAVREGCAVPLDVAYDNGSQARTPPVTIAIRKGGGPCVDPPAAGYGQITWQKTISTTDQGVASETDTMTASLQASPGQQAPPRPVYNGFQGSQTLFGPACPVAGYRSLGAGTVTIQGPGLSATQVPVVPFQSGQVSGLSAYQASLPAGTVQAGNFTVMASGGPDVGAFRADVNVGADIQIQTPLAGNLGTCPNFTINWTGGDPNSWVTLKLISRMSGVYGGWESAITGAQNRTANGSVPLAFPEGACPLSAQPVEISIEVDPDPAQITIFSAPGLSLGGRATWKYLHTFQATLGTD